MIEPHERRHVGRDVVLTFAGRLALMAAILAGDVIIARVLGPDGKGAFTLVLALTSLGSVILALGLERSFGVFAARSIDLAKSSLANATLWTLVVGSLGGLAILALAPIAPILPPLSQTELLLVGLSLPLELGYILGLVGLLGRQRVVAFNVGRFLRRGLLTALVIGVVFIGRLDLTGLLVLNLATLTMSVAVVLWAMVGAGMTGGAVDASLLRDQLLFGVRSFVGVIAERVHYRAAAFMLTAFIGVSATGVYSVALGLAETVWYLPTSFGLVLFSRAVQPGADSASIASIMTRTMLALIVAGALPLWLIAPWLVELVYGAPFAAAGVAFQIILPGVAAYSIVAVLGQFIVAWNAPGRLSAMLITGLAVNLGANLILIPPFGMNGAALAASISYTTTAVLVLLVYVRLSGRSLRETILVRRSDFSAVWMQLRLRLVRP